MRAQRSKLLPQPSARKLSVTFKTLIDIRPAAYFALSIAILVLPISWVLSAISAVTIHECGHICMLLLRKIPIQKIEIGATGARIHTPYQSNTDELLTAAAGPAMGLLAAGLIHIPMVRICCFVQSLFNLMPVYPLDGGRILRSACIFWAGESKYLLIYRIMQMLLMSCILFFLFY